MFSKGCERPGKSNIRYVDINFHIINTGFTSLLSPSAAGASHWLDDWIRIINFPFHTNIELKKD